MFNVSGVCSQSMCLAPQWLRKQSDIIHGGNVGSSKHVYVQRFGEQLVILSSLPSAMGSREGSASKQSAALRYRATC